MKTPVEILEEQCNTHVRDTGIIWITSKQIVLVDVIKAYAKAWLDEAAEVAMLQAEKGLPVGDAIYKLKDEIDKH